MKQRLIILLLATGAAGFASGQGTVTSANNSNSRITNILTAAPLPAGTYFSVALYYLPDTGVTPSLGGGIWEPNPGWVMLGPRVHIGPAGLYQIGTRTTPSTTPPGGAAWFQVRVWETAFGATFDEAWNNPVVIGGRGMLGFFSDVMYVTTGDPTPPFPDVPGRANPAGFLPIIPEPSVLGLGLLGGGALWLWRGCRCRRHPGRRPQHPLTNPGARGACNLEPHRSGTLDHEALKAVLLLASALLGGMVASAQMPLQNLNFEAAVLPPVPDPNPQPPDYGRVDISLALPGWTAYVGTNLERRILYDNVFLDSAGIGIFNTNCVNPMIAPYCRVLQEQYTAWLQAGYGIPFGGPYDVSLAQTGLIPNGMQTMAFTSIGAFGTDPTPHLRVSVAGLPAPLYLLNARPDFMVYGVDVSSHAGQEAEIRFTTDSRLYLDAITFNTTRVPEPSVVSLACLAAVLGAFAAGRRRARRRRFGGSRGASQSGVALRLPPHSRR